MSATDLAVADYFNIPNGLFHFATPVSVPATCSFDISWSGPVTDRSPVTAPTDSSGALLSSGDLVTCEATMQWSASIPSTGWRFESNPEGTTSVFAQLGKVKNGVFAD